MTTHRSETDRLCARAAALCRRIAARELTGVPLYIVPQTRLPHELGGASVCGGYTSPSLDLHLQEHIPVWRGRGACFVVNDGFLWRETGGDGFEPEFMAVAVHELAHIIDRPSPYRPREQIAAHAVRREAREVAAAVSGEPPAAERAVPFLGHGARFIRIALHLRHRAERAGCPLVPSMLCGGMRYGLSHAARYRRALGDEPERMAGMTFRAICKTEPPEAFLKLWHSDLAHWFPERKDRA